MERTHARSYQDMLQRRLLSSLLARGMSAADFVNVVNAQHARQDDVVDPRYPVAVSAVLHMCTLAATRIKYKADAHVPNLAYMTANLTEAEQRVFMPPEYFGETAKKVEEMAAQYHRQAYGTYGSFGKTASYGPPSPLLGIPELERMTATAATMYLHASTGRAKMDARRSRFSRFAGGTSEATATPASSSSLHTILSRAYVMDDDWSFTAASTQGDADDCEGVAALVGVVHERQRDVLNNATNTLTPELHAMRLISNTFEPLFEGGTVSEPYVKDEGKTGSAGEDAGPPPHPPLPVKGTVEAAKRKAGGHGFGEYKPQCVRQELQLNALNHFPNSALPPEDFGRLRNMLEKAVNAAPTWARRAVNLRMVIEGTGQVHPLILPAAETYKDSPVFTAKTNARIDFVRALRAKGFYAAGTTSKPTHRDEMTLLADCARAESQPYDKEARTDPLQWVSSFYRGIAGVISLRAYREESPLLAACAAIDLRSNVRGVDMATMLTTCTEHVALHPQYGAGITEREWTRDIQPYIDAALEQLPVSNYLRELDLVPGAGQVAVPLDASVVPMLASTRPILLQATLDGTCEAQGEDLSALAQIESASSQKDSEVLALTLDVQSLPALGEQKANQLLVALKKLKTDGKIKAYSFIRDQPLLNCSACLQVLLLLPVEGVV
jgi:hypothetical protein